VSTAPKSLIAKEKPTRLAAAAINAFTPQYDPANLMHPKYSFWRFARAVARSRT
jgi:hypothetical protein